MYGRTVAVLIIAAMAYPIWFTWQVLNCDGVVRSRPEALGLYCERWP